MRTYFFNKFNNGQRKELGMKKQIQIISSCPTTLQRTVKRRKRTPEKTVLLLKAMMSDIKRLESKGIIRKNGRKWTINF